MSPTPLPLEPPSLSTILAARRRIAGIALKTPLVRLDADDASAEIWLKLENLQPVGSFKLRGAANAMLAAGATGLADGVWTVSAGNMAQAVAACARRLKVECTAIVPLDSPANKIEAVARLGARIVAVPFADYQQIQVTHEFAGMRGRLIHPFADADVMAGNGTIALEILEDLPEVEAIFVPYGGGGLSCGIAAAVNAVAPRVKVIATEVESGAPLTPSWAAGEPVRVDYRHSFVSGIGAPFVFPEMWPLARRLLDGAVSVTLSETAQAIKLMAERSHVIAEGAAGTAVAGVLAHAGEYHKVACVVSGGNIDAQQFAQILAGGVP